MGRRRTGPRPDSRRHGAYHAPAIGGWRKGWLVGYCIGRSPDLAKAAATYWHALARVRPRRSTLSCRADSRCVDPLLRRSTRTRRIIKATVHGGKACGPTVDTVPCNKHACGYKPHCHSEHVGCTVAEVRTGLGLTMARVMRVTHHRANMHVAANYQCSMINGFRECSCRCDRQPECCEYKNRILTNDVLLGNRFEGIANSKACCDMCNTHPDCTSWQFVHTRSDVQIPGTCVLKGGSPSYIDNDDLAFTTWAGVRAGLTGPKCQKPEHVRYTIPAPTVTPPSDQTDHSQHAGVPTMYAGGVN